MLHLTSVVILACVPAIALAGSATTRQENQGVVSGRVARPGGVEGIPDVRVTLIGPMVGQAERALASFPLMAAEIAERLGIAQIPATTDGDGRTTFRNLAPGLYALLFSREGHFGAALPGGPLTSALVSSKATVVVGSPTPDVVVTMVRGSTVRGTVRDETGKPLSSARVVLVGESSSGRAAMTARTNQNGTFEIAVPPDAYKLLASSDTPGVVPFGALILAAPGSNADFISKVRSAGLSIAVGEGVELDIAVTVTPTELSR